MKKLLLLLLVPLWSTFITFSQTELTVTAPNDNGSTTGLRGPNGTTVHTILRGVIIVPASELTNIPPSTLITKLGFLLATAGGPGPAGGNIQFYLENTTDVTNLKPSSWTTIISTMTSVYSGVFNLPTTAGPSMDLTLSTPFLYNGGSMYVAYDYTGATFATNSWTYSTNNTLAGGWKGASSATTTPPTTLTLTSGFRPCIRFTFDNPFTNELNVTGVAGEKGIFNNTIQTTQTVTSIISNTSQGSLNNIPVTLDITGANPYTEIQTIPSIAAGASATVLFTNVPTITLGSQTITITIPNDEVNSNNVATFLQKIQCDTIGYVQNSIQSSAIGFNTSSGIVAVKHVVPNTITTFVKSISNYFPNDPGILGNTMKGLLINSNGVIIDSTALITLTSAMPGTKQDFLFLNGNINVSSETIYLGFRQNANATAGYFPFAYQENSYVDPNAGATIPINGGLVSPLGSGFGYMMIEGVLTYGGFEVANSLGSTSICSNSSIDITATPGYTNYDFYINGASVQNGSIANFITAPLTNNITYNVIITNGTCNLYSDTTAIQVSSTIINNISASICQGQTFIFGNQTISTTGIYSDTLSSLSGCDSVVTLNLNVNTPAAGVDSHTECGSYTWIDGVTYSTSNNSATFNIVGGSANGCDSIVTLNLTINSLPVVSVSVSDLTISANNVNATYQWLDCNNNSPIAGEISQSFTAMINGSYAVELSQNGCVDTSNCIEITTVGTIENLLFNEFKISPNPSNGDFFIAGPALTSITLYNQFGQKVNVTFSTIGEGKYQVMTKQLANGSYILELQNEGAIVRKSIQIIQ
jgi:hypothetical protein